MASNTVWLALVSAGFVYRDAKRQRLPRPLAWAGAVLIFWIVALPCYLWQRRNYKAPARLP